MNNDWIKPVAYMRDTEYTMELLRKWFEPFWVP
jgi:hypothetical protein